MVYLDYAFFFTKIIFTATLLTSISAGQPLHGRSDLKDVPPISDSGYEVPLVGSQTCTTPEICISTLPAPGSGRILKQVTLGRGTFTYTCADTVATDQATCLSESVNVYDVAAILPFLPNEASFHSLVPQFYAYDYSELQNASLSCVGSIYTDHGSTIVALYNYDTFPVEVKAAIHTPDNTAFDADWVYSTTVDGAWEVYRVETYGGTTPATCQDHNGTFELGFAAEYWFYST